MFSTSIRSETKSKTKPKNKAQKKVCTITSLARCVAWPVAGMAQAGMQSSMHASAWAWPNDHGPCIVHATSVVHGLVSQSTRARWYFITVHGTFLCDPMVTRILGEDPIAMECSNFEMDLIHMILDVFDDDQVARSLLSIK